MDKTNLQIKLEFIPGLEDIVLNELESFSDFQVISKEEDCLYLEFNEDLAVLKGLRSVLKIFIIARDHKYNPQHICKHKSLLGDIIALAMEANDDFETFKIICAGADSSEVRAIAEYIRDTFKLAGEEDDADLKVHIIKRDEAWEIGVQATPMPLSVRSYRVENMEGAMNPTIAYALNSLCGLENARSYLNIFSGSATLLIEAGQCYPHLENLLGFDNNKDHLTIAMRNIKEAGLIRKIKLKEADIFDQPDLGRFDAICSDLPFGMLVSKYEDLENLYRSFFEYAKDHLNPDGALGIYTSRSEIIKKLIAQTDFEITKELEFKLMTNANTYLYPAIFICQLKK